MAIDRCNGYSCTRLYDQVYSSCSTGDDSDTADSDVAAAAVVAAACCCACDSMTGSRSEAE